MRESNTRYAVLGVLAEGGSLTGYDIRSRIEGSLGLFWSESFGQIYPELRRLRADGLVEPAAREGEGKPYRITAAGRAALATWLARPPAAERPRSELQLKLHFGRFMGADAVRGFLVAAAGAAAERAGALRARRASVMDHLAGEQRLFSLLALDRGLGRAEADIAWAKRALAVVDALAEGGPDDALQHIPPV